MQYYFAFVGLLNSICALLAGCYVYFKSRQNPTHISFFYFALSTALWSAVYSVWQIQTTYYGALFWMRLAMLPCFYIPFAFLWFCMSLTEHRLTNFSSLLTATVPTLFGGFTFSTYAIPTVSSKMYFRFWPDPGNIIHAYLIVFILILIWAFSLLFYRIKIIQGEERSKLRWLTYVCLLAWAGGATNWFLWYDIPIPPFFNFFVGVFFFFITFLLLRGNMPGFEDMAHAAHEDKLRTLGVLAASINHEIKNPLYVIKSLAESHLLKLKEGQASYEDLKSDSTKLADQVYRQATRTFEIIERLSRFLKAEGNQKTCLKEIHLKHIFDHVVPLISNQMAMNQIHLEVQVSPGLESLNGDERILEQVIFNLLVNAYQALKDKKGERNVLLKAYSEKGQVIAEVSDSAGGLEKTTLNNIFKPFYTTKEKGTGLGLYITKKLIEKISGEISVFPSPNGTVFKLGFKACRS